MYEYRSSREGGAILIAEGSVLKRHVHDFDLELHERWVIEIREYATTAPRQGSSE
jgi:hypothetical protein